ncbi:MAG: hypothetical protein ACE5H7_06185 [Acidiferrobacterales bacterium]
MKKLWKWISVENNRNILAFIGAGIAAVAIAAWTIFVYFDGDHPAMEKTDEDIRLERELVGTWEATTQTLEGATLHVQFTLLQGGKISWRGYTAYQGQKTPVILSGSWQVRRSYLQYTVESSNVPSVIPNGFTSANKILSVSDTELKHVDGLDGKTKIISRIK